MFVSRPLLTGLCLGLVQVNAHFLLNYPATVGFSDDDEGKAPCGGFEVNFNNVTNFFVGGDAIALTSLHPTSVWLYRATLDTTAAGNWSVLLPAIAQSTQGQFCEKGVTVPTSFAGQKGVLQVIQSSVDGQLYQCAAVNFVSGVNPSVPSVCVNQTGLSATFTTDAALSTIVGSGATAASGSSGASSTGTASASLTGSSTGSGASPSTSKSASAETISGRASESLLWGLIVALGSVAVAVGL